MPDDRITRITRDLVAAIMSVVEKHHIAHEEYRAAVDFLHATGRAGEMPLLADVFLEAAVVDANNSQARGTTPNVLGPYYLAESPWVEDGKLASRNEPGEPLTLSGTVRNVNGDPLAGTLLEFWQADAAGKYSNFDAGTADFHLRGRLHSGEDGSYELHTVRPAPYTIPHHGPTGRLLTALGRHAWRPAHIHVRATHKGHRPLITQIYFDGDIYLDSDAANAARAELVRPVDRVAGGSKVRFDVVLANRL